MRKEESDEDEEDDFFEIFSQYCLASSINSTRSQLSHLLDDEND